MTVAAPARPKTDRDIGYFDVKPAMEAAKDPAKEGRLARLTYEFACRGTVGKNMRVYPTEVFDPAAKDLNARCQQGRILGRMDHPSEWSDEAFRVTTRDAAVICVSVECVGDNKVRVVEDVLDNSHGRQLMSILAAGGNPGISQRGMALWESATREEKSRYGIPEDGPLEIARVLRLVTYDTVSNPGFDDASNPIVTEEALEEAPMKTVAEVKAGLPEVAAALILEGKEAAKAEAKTAASAAMEAEKPALIEAATKPLKDKVTELEATNLKLTGALEAVKPILAGAGIALETVADTEVAKRMGTMATELATTKAELATTKAANEAAQTELKTLKGKESARAITAKVEEKYGKSKFWPQIKSACEGETDETKALEKAAAKVGEINSMAALFGVKVDASEAAPVTAPANGTSGGAGGGGGGGGGEKGNIGTSIWAAGTNR